MTWWGSYARGVSFKCFSGDHGAGENEWPTENCEGLFFLQNPFFSLAF